jgi:hypothetical protein
MNIPGLMDQSLRDLHALIAECLAADDNAPGERPFGVREYRDWRRQADAFEAELRTRNLAFNPIQW